MMKMNTQFGDMVLTDDNKTIVNEELKKEIEDKIQDNKKPELIIQDSQIDKEVDK